MMGGLPPGQNALFYEFCLDNRVSEDHLLRHIHLQHPIYLARLAAQEDPDREMKFVDYPLRADGIKIAWTAAHF